MKTLAIIGQSASGKSDLAHFAARETGAVLLSMDSLSVYKNIDIASAKPTEKERKDLTYFGLNIVDPCDRFGAEDFATEYMRAKSYCEANRLNLIIVGGSGFYLKSLASGLSPIPHMSKTVLDRVFEMLNDLPSAYAALQAIDPICAAKIASADRYRIEKALLIAYASGETPTNWFMQNPPRSLIDHLAIAVVQRPIEELRDRIALRTRKMIECGLVAEIENLLTIAPRSAQPMKAIGVKETIDFIDGKTTIEEMENLINIHTAQFAKRQRTYNNGQFSRLIALADKELTNFAVKYLRFKR